MIQATERALLEQLREDGLLLDAENKVLPKDGAADATELMRDWD